MVAVDKFGWVIVAEQGETNGDDKWDQFYEFPFRPEGKMVPPPLIDELIE
jgi:hypothetical protein